MQSQKFLYYESKVKRDVLVKLEAHITDVERQLDELKRLAPERLLQIQELKHSMYDFQVAAEREEHRLDTKIQAYKRYDRVQAQLQENEYARVQAEEQEQAHKRPRL